MNALTACKISRVKMAVRIPLEFDEPKEVDLSHSSVGTVVMHCGPDTWNLWPFFFMRKIPPESKVHLFDDWIAVDPIEPIKALSKVVT